jgi:hypothetical protein
VRQFIIEREIANAGRLSDAELGAVSARSCAVLKQLGPSIHWIHSYVTDDKIYCVYLAPSEAVIREHARLGGFPVNRVSEVRDIIEPGTSI